MQCAHSSDRRIISVSDGAGILTLENSWLDIGMCSPFCMAICSSIPLSGNVMSGFVSSLGRGHVRSNSRLLMACQGTDVVTIASSAISDMLRARAVSKVGFLG